MWRDITRKFQNPESFQEDKSHHMPPALQFERYHQTSEQQHLLLKYSTAEFWIKT